MFKDLMESKPIIITNPKIIEFFKDYDNKNIENTIIYLIDFISIIQSQPQLKHSEENLDKSDNSIQINKYVLDEIGKEFNLFTSKKDEIVGIIKDTQRRALSAIESMSFPSLEKYLYDHCDSFNNNITFENLYRCELCNYYVCNSKKSLSAHQRGCKKYVGSL